MDKISKSRSWNMSRIGSKDTNPREKLDLLHTHGVRSDVLLRCDWKTRRINVTVLLFCAWLLCLDIVIANTSDFQEPTLTFGNKKYHEM